MLSGLKHFVRENLQDIIESSYLNCHVKGVHSFMLIDYPGKSVRVYHAEPDHDLGRNMDIVVSNNRSSARPLSVAFHSHRRNLTLEVIQGTLYNSQAFEDSGAYYPHKLDKFEYRSQIVDGEMKFNKIDSDVKMVIKNATPLTTNGGQSSMFLPADYIHSIAVEPQKTCTWIVYEGAENTSYDSVCYSNADLEKLSSEGLYVRPTEEQVRHFMIAMGLM